MNQLPPGTEVVRVPCPDECDSTCHAIPIGSLGVMGDYGPEKYIEAPKDDEDNDGPILLSTVALEDATQYLHRINWKMPNGKTRGWWTHEHAFVEAGPPFPDKTWIE